MNKILYILLITLFITSGLYANNTLNYQVEKIFDVPGKTCMGLTFDGTNFWTSEIRSKNVICFSPEKQKIFKKFKINFRTMGIGFNNQNLILTDSRKKEIIVIDPEKGTIINKIKTLAGLPIGIEYNNKLMWLCDSKKPDSIKAINTENKIVKNFKAPGNSPFAIAIEKKYIWVSNNKKKGIGSIYKLSKKTGEILGNFKFKQGKGALNGLVKKDDALWVLSLSTKKIFKLKFTDKKLKTKIIKGYTDLTLSKEEIKFKSAKKAIRQYCNTAKKIYFQLAVTNLNSILNSNPDHIEAAIKLADLYTKKAHYTADVIKEKKIKNKKLYFTLGNLYLSQNRYEKAIECYDIVIKAVPRWACPLRHKGEALLKKGDIKNAVKTLTKCIKVKKLHFDAYVFLAKALLLDKQYKKAKKITDIAVKQFEKSKGCNHDDEPEAYLSDCYYLYKEIYKALGDKVKYKKYTDLYNKTK